MSQWMGKVVLSIFLVCVCLTLFQSYLLLNIDMTKLPIETKDRINTIRRWILLFIICLFVLVSVSMLETRLILLYGVRVVGLVMFVLRFIVFVVSVSISVQVIMYFDDTDTESIPNYTTIRNLSYASLACSGAWFLVVIYKRYQDYNDTSYQQSYLLRFDKEWKKHQPFKVSTKKLSCNDQFSFIFPTDATFVSVRSLPEFNNEELKSYSDYIALQTSDDQYSDYRLVFKQLVGSRLKTVDGANDQIAADANRVRYEFGTKKIFDSFPSIKQAIDSGSLNFFSNITTDPNQNITTDPNQNITTDPNQNNAPIIDWKEILERYPELSQIEKEIINHYFPEVKVVPELKDSQKQIDKQDEKEIIEVEYPRKQKLGTILIDHQLYQLGIRDWNVNYTIKVLLQQGAFGDHFAIGGWGLFPYNVFGSEYPYLENPGRLGFYTFDKGIIEESFPDYTQPLIKRRQSHRVYLTSSGDLITENHMYFGLGYYMNQIKHTTVEGFDKEQMGGLAAFEYVIMFNVTKQKVYYLYKNYAWANQTIQRFMELVSRQAYTDRQVEIQTLCNCFEILLTTRVINETDYEVLNDCSSKEVNYRLADFCHPDELRQSELAYILGFIIYSLPSAKQTTLIEQITPILHEYDLEKLQAWKTKVLPKLVKEQK